MNNEPILSADCPICGADAIQRNKRIANGTKLYCLWKCTKCAHSWSSIYTLYFDGEKWIAKDGTYQPHIIIN